MEAVKHIVAILCICLFVVMACGGIIGAAGGGNGGRKA